MVISFRQFFCSQDGFARLSKVVVNPHPSIPSNGRISEARHSAFFVGSFRTLRYEIILGSDANSSATWGFYVEIPNTQMPNKCWKEIQGFMN